MSVYNSSHLGLYCHTSGFSFQYRQVCWESACFCACQFRPYHLKLLLALNTKDWQPSIIFCFSCCCTQFWLHNDTSFPWFCQKQSYSWASKSSFQGIVALQSSCFFPEFCIHPMYGSIQLSCSCSSCFCPQVSAAADRCLGVSYAGHSSNSLVVVQHTFLFHNLFLQCQWRAVVLFMQFYWIFKISLKNLFILCIFIFLKVFFLHGNNMFPTEIPVRSGLLIAQP